MKISPARKLAFEVLQRVEQGRAHAGDLLHASRNKEMRAPDAALATELVLGILRWQGLLDFLIERQAGKRVERLDPEVRVALRLGLYQLRFLERVPAHAAVNESVELVKQAKKRSAAGFVNAVLRRAEAKARIEELLSSSLGLAERLALVWSHPVWLVRRWLERFGEQRTVALLEADNRAPRATFALPQGETASEIVKQLTKAGMRAVEGRWLKSAVEVEAGSNKGKTVDERTKQRLRPQDEASQMVALLLDVRPGHKVLDLCAAPGGKTATLAEAAGQGGKVIAADIHLRRLRAMRLPFSFDERGEADTATVERVALDGTQELPFTGVFDRILADAPCSGTGTLSRNPEIRWRLKPGDLADLHGRQVAMLRNTLAGLAKGGRLVYSTCSLEPEENEDVVREALEGSTSFERVSGAEALRRHLQAGVRVEELCDECGDFRTFPPEHGTDGFYAATLLRR